MFAKAKGLLAMPFRVQNQAFTMYVYTGVAPPNNTANVHATFINKCVDDWVACFVMNTCPTSVVFVELSISGGGRSKATKLGPPSPQMMRPNCRANFYKYVERTRALEAAKENGGCIVFHLAMNVTLADTDDGVKRTTFGELPYLRFLPNDYSSGLRDLRSDLLDAYVAAEDGGVSGGFQVVVVAAANGNPEKVFDTHKFILAARSPVLRAMLASSMTEASSGRMEIIGYSRGAVSGFVRFLYTDTCEEEALAEHGWELLELADKYDVPALRRVCESWLGGHINAANAIETLQRADANNAPSLKRKALHYVATNKKRALGGNSQAALRELGADLLSEVVCAIAD